METTEYALAFHRAIFVHKGDNHFAFYISLMLARTGTSEGFPHSILFHFKPCLNITPVFILPYVRKQKPLQ